MDCPYNADSNKNPFSIIRKYYPYFSDRQCEEFLALFAPRYYYYSLIGLTGDSELHNTLCGIYMTVNFNGASKV